MRDVRVSTLRKVKETKFSDLVAADVRNEISAEDAAMLRMPENLDAFYDELVGMLSSFDAQLTKQRITSIEKREEFLAAQRHDDWTKYHLDTLRWRKSIAQMRRFTETKIREVRALRRGTIPKDQTQPVFDLAALLYRAIVTHQDEYHNPRATDEDLNVADNTLWAIVNLPEVQDMARRFDQVPV